MTLKSTQKRAGILALAVLVLLLLIAGFALSVVEDGQRDDLSRCERARQRGLSCDWGKSDVGVP